MKVFKLNYMILLAVAIVFSSVSVFAQQKDNKEVKEEIIIIKETIDEDGNVEVTKIITKGDAECIIIKTMEGVDFEVFDIDIDALENVHIIKLEELEGLSEELQEKLKNIHIDINDDNGNKHIKIIMDKDGDGGEPIIIEWEGEGDIPEDIQKKLDENDIILNGGMFHENHAYRFVTRNAPQNKACLGVMIGMTVENENGVETVKAGSKEGVAILDVFEDSGAEAAGLLKDDIITGISGTSVMTINDVLDVLKPYEGGETVLIAYLRNNQPAQTNATLKTCENKVKMKHFESFGDNDFEFKKEMNWVFESEEEGEHHTKRIIIIKKSRKTAPEVEELEIVPVEDDDVAYTEDDPLKTVSVDQPLELVDFSMYPNPTAGNLNVEFSGEAVPTSIKIIDITGKEVYNEEILNFNGTYKNEISLVNIAKGTLMLTVMQNDKVFAEKLVAQ